MSLIAESRSARSSEGADVLDRVAQREMGMSGVEFLARWDRGEFAGVNWDDVPGLADVAMVIDFAR